MPGAHMLLIEEDDVLCDIVEQNVHAHGNHVWIAKDAQSTPGNPLLSNVGANQTVTTTQ